jgi:hypothetical protein
MRMSRDEFFAEFGNKGLCGLCGNTGKINTVGRAISPMGSGARPPGPLSGIDAGGEFFCLCPNGRAMKKANNRRQKVLSEPLKKLFTFSPNAYKTYHPNSKEVYFGPYWEDHCPGCGEKATSVCRCLINSRLCSNGHEWYRDKQGHAVAGSGH